MKKEKDENKVEEEKKDETMNNSSNKTEEYVKNYKFLAKKDLQWKKI